MLNSIHTQVLHAFGKMGVAMRNSLISFGLNIVLNLVLSHFFGLNGIALATTVSVVAVVYLYKWSAQKCLPDYKLIIPPKFGLKLLAGAASCALIAFLVKRFISSAILSFGFATLSGFLGFAEVLIFLTEENLTGLVEKVLRRKKVPEAGGGNPGAGDE